MGDLVERLRFYASGQWANGAPGFVCVEAADALEAAQARIAALEAELARAREAARKARHVATNRAYMLAATTRMLGPKGRQVWQGWQDKGVLRVHYDWGQNAPFGEDCAQVILDWEEAAKSATPIDSIDGHLAALKAAQP